jgi:tellurite resistance protein
LQFFPVSFFAMVMGMVGLTIAWEKASELYQINSVIHHTLLIQSMVAFTILLVIYGIKSVLYREAVSQEWSNPVKINFLPAISISMLLFSVALLPIDQTASRISWIAGSALHLVISMYVINSWLNHGQFEISHITPAWFIPALGNVIVPLAGVPLGYLDISWFFFSIGMMFWLVLLAIVFNRVIFHQRLPQRLLPTLFILIAPPAVGFLSYMKLTGNLDAFAYILYKFALFLGLLLLSQLPRFARLPFYLSWWAYSFPLAALSIASMVMADISGNKFYGYIGLGLLYILSALVLVLFLKTLRAVLDGTICAPEHQ